MASRESDHVDIIVRLASKSALALSGVLTEHYQLLVAAFRRAQQGSNEPILDIPTFHYNGLAPRKDRWVPRGVVHIDPNAIQAIEVPHL